MTVFDLLFIAVFSGTIGALAASVYFLVRGRYRHAGRIAGGLSGFLAIYLLIVVLVALATPQRFLALGEDQCFDDFCVAVMRSEIKDGHCRVIVRVSSRAKRRVQRAPDAAVYLIDSAGREYRRSEAGRGRPMTDFLRP